MVNRVVAGGGAAALLAAGVLIGGVSTGIVGAHSLHQTGTQASTVATRAQATPTDTPESPADQPDSEPAGPTVTLPAGSITSDQAQQAAATYVQNTAPYSGEGLAAQSVTVDSENGTVLFTVNFSDPTGKDVEVLVSTGGSVVGVDAGQQSDAGNGQVQDQGEQAGASDNGGEAD